MRALVASVTAAVMLAASPASAQSSCEGGVCVAKDDLMVFLKLAKDHKCREGNPPKITMDPITIVVDKEGRIYGSGSEPKPYKMHISWCNYEIDANGTVKMIAARKLEPDYGFRLRYKFTSGLLPVESFRGESWTAGVDAGLMLDFAYWKVLNANVHVGFRSIGIGAGVDITRNFGAYVGYANTWGEWRSNLYTGLYFGF